MNMRSVLCVLVLVVMGALQVMAMTDEEIRGAYATSYGYEKIQDYDNAIKVLADVLYTDSRGYFVNLRLGWLNYMKGQYADARVHYQLAIKASSGSIEARLGLMLPLLAQTRYADVEVKAREIIAVDPGNYYANLRLAYVLRLQAKPTQALAVLSPMVGRYPSDTSLLLETGLNRVALKQTESARKIFNAVLLHEPENVTAKTQLYYLPR